jgi:PadR family transcriptional regulator PadR
MSRPGPPQRFLIEYHDSWVGEHSLYPALHTLEQKGWLRSEWKQSETGREAKFYSLTAAGRKQLAAKKEGWAAGAVQLIFNEGR